jgi:hypothetical protein
MVLMPTHVYMLATKNPITMNTFSHQPLFLKIVDKYLIRIATIQQLVK